MPTHSQNKSTEHKLASCQTSKRVGTLPGCVFVCVSVCADRQALFNANLVGVRALLLIRLALDWCYEGHTIFTTRRD